MDSGAERTVLDAAADGEDRAEFAIWGKDGTIYFQRHDARGTASFWSVSPAGGMPRLLVRYDPALHASSRGSLSVGHGRFYFPSEDRQSDIWVMEVGRP